MKNILLIGINGVYNYGCEAIIRGTYNILKQCHPDANITYASYNYEYDKNRLRDLDLNILDRKHIGKWSMRNITRKALSFLGIKYENPFDNHKVFAAYDYVFSIGGDMYTLNSDNSYNACLPEFMEKLQKAGAKYILWGCSVGPFEKNSDALKYFKKHLSNVDLIIAREFETINYLKQLGIENNVRFAPDPAFMVEGPTKTTPTAGWKNLTIGINLSPLSASYEYGDIKNAIAIQCNIISKLIKRYDANIILLPHVLSNSSFDNDLTYLSDLKNCLSEDDSKRVSVISNDPGFIGLKNQILNCDFVLAARMHCAINAVTCGVPTLFISYSKKAVGLNQFIYGNNNNVLSVKEFADFDLLTKKIDRLIKEINDKPMNLNKIQSFNYGDILNL